MSNGFGSVGLATWISKATWRWRTRIRRGFSSVGGCGGAGRKEEGNDRAVV